MINRYFYQSEVKSFLVEDTDAIFGKMACADDGYGFNAEVCVGTRNIDYERYACALSQLESANQF